MPKRNRSAAESIILKRIEDLSPGGPTPAIYRAMFDAMDDEQFHEFMMKLKAKQISLTIIAPNLAKSRLTIKNCLAIADAIGHEFWQRIWITPADGSPAYLTNKSYLVLLLPWRRQAQLLEKKIRIPKHNRSIDDLTGQPSGESKGSKISSPEMQVLAALNLPNVITEQMKYRGGDVKGYNAMIDMIDKTGEVSMDAIAHLAGGVESTRTLSIYLSAMHIANTAMP